MAGTGLSYMQGHEQKEWNSHISFLSHVSHLSAKNIQFVMHTGLLKPQIFLVPYPNKEMIISLRSFSDSAVLLKCLGFARRLNESGKFNLGKLWEVFPR